MEKHVIRFADTKANRCCFGRNLTKTVVWVDDLQAWFEPKHNMTWSAEHIARLERVVQHEGGVVVITNAEDDYI